MWAADLYKDKVLLKINSNNYTIKINNCCAVTGKNRYYYFLCSDKVLVWNNKFINKFSVIDKFSNNIIVSDKIYVSGEDAGSISIYNFDGSIEKSVNIGEHIADFKINDNYIFAITYNDNFLIKTNFTEINKISLDYSPQRIILNDYIYVLLNDENFSFIRMYDINFVLMKTIKLKRQIGDIFLFYNKIIFNGSDFNYVFTKKLTLISQKNSTGDFLCRFSDIPIFEKTTKIFDVINNIIYPL